MKLQELQKLAEKVQLKIKPEEVGHLLVSLSELEKLLVEFRQLQLEKQFCQLQVKTTLKDLRQLAKKYSIHAVEQEIIRHNAEFSAKNFLVVRRKKAVLSNN